MLKARMIRGALVVATSLLAMNAAHAQDRVSLGTWMWNEPGIGDWWKIAGEAFAAANPGVELEVRNLPVNEYMTQIVIELASGNPADIVSVSSNLPELQGSGGLVPLNDRIEAAGLMDAVEQACWDRVTFDGNIMAIPIAGRTLTLLWNEELFAAAGLDGPPTTPEEFLDHARRLTVRDDSGNVTQYGASMVNTAEEPTFEMLMMWSIAFGGSMTDGAMPTLTDPGVVEALTFMKTLYDEGLIPRGRPEDDQRALFANGTSAMEIDGPWQVSFVRSISPERAENVHAAVLPWDGPATGGPNVLISLGNTGNQDLAWKFIEAVLSPEVQSRFNEFSDVVPCAVGAIGEETIAAKPYLAAELEMFQAGPLAPSPAGFEDVASEFQAYVLEAVSATLQGGEDPATALAEAQDTIIDAFGL